MAPLRGLRRHPGRGALLPLSPRRAPRPRAVAAGEEDPRVGGRLRLDRPPHEPSDRTLSWERRPRPVRQGARQGRAEIRRQSGGREDVPRLGLPAHPQRAVPEGLHPYREPGRRDRGARAPEQAPHRRLRPLEVQGRRGRILPRRGIPGRMDDLADRSATELARLVAKREVSPVEVVEACLARVERYNPLINAVVTLNPRALDDARALEQRLAQGAEVGLLAGVPVGIKDVTPVAGLRTTYGSPLYRDHVPVEDALVVQRLRAAGAIILGKTNCPEFAAAGNTFNEVFGRTRNPWDPTRSAGGSTGGGAAGLITGMMALAEGTDLGGSLRIPASFCGVVGLRPSVGLVPTYPTDWVWDTLQVEGPVARTAQDVALMLQAVAGPNPLSPLSQPTAGRNFVAAAARGIPQGLRVAYCPDIARIGIDPAIERVCRRAAVGLGERDVEVEEIDLDLSFGRQAFFALRGLWFVAQMFPRMEQLDQFGANVAGNIRAGLDTTTRELGAAEAARGRMWHLFRELFGKFDHLVTPCMAVPPFPVDLNYPDTVAGTTMETHVDWIAATFALSLTGLPAAWVPCGLEPGGLPVGLQIVGRPFGEEALLALAAQVQQRHPIGRPTLRA